MLFYSFVPASVVISLRSSIADAADRSTTTVVAAVGVAEHENYDELINKFFAPAVDQIVAADQFVRPAAAVISIA